MDECETNDCSQALKELDLFLDAELSTTARETVHIHLDHCPDCLSAFDFHAELKQVIRTKCQENEIPAELLTRIEKCFDADFSGDDVTG